MPDKKKVVVKSKPKLRLKLSQVVEVDPDDFEDDDDEDDAPSKVVVKPKAKPGVKKSQDFDGEPVGRIKANKYKKAGVAQPEAYRGKPTSDGQQTSVASAREFKATGHTLPVAKNPNAKD